MARQAVTWPGRSPGYEEHSGPTRLLDPSFGFKIPVWDSFGFRVLLFRHPEFAPYDTGGPMLKRSIQIRLGALVILLAAGFGGFLHLIGPLPKTTAWAAFALAW